MLSNDEHDVAFSVECVMRKERSWKFWFFLIVGIALVCSIVYYIFSYFIMVE